MTSVLAVVVIAMRPHRPADADELVGHGDRGLVDADAVIECRRPSLQSIELVGCLVS